MIYTFLDSITMLYNMHNIISAVMILISMLTTKTTNVFHALIFFSIGWIFITIFTFDREILPSYFYFGFSYVESDKESQITLQKSSLICIWFLNVYLLCTNFNFSILPSYHQKYLFYGKFLPFSQ